MINHSSEMNGVGAYEHQVDDSFVVNAGAKVLVISAGETCADSVVGVHHTRNAIESVEGK